MGSVKQKMSKIPDKNPFQNIFTLIYYRAKTGKAYQL